MSADTDVSRAWLARWNGASPEALAVQDLVKGGVAAGRLPAPGASPYAELSTETHKPPQFVTGGAHVDYRKVTVTLFGVGREAVGRVVSALRALFDSPAALDFGFSAAVVAHLRTEPLGETDAVDDRQKSGDDVRKVTVPWVVWTHRSRG